MKLFGKAVISFFLLQLLISCGGGKSERAPLIPSGPEPLIINSGCPSNTPEVIPNVKYENYAIASNISHCFKLKVERAQTYIFSSFQVNGIADSYIYRDASLSTESHVVSEVWTEDFTKPSDHDGFSFTAIFDGYYYFKLTGNITTEYNFTFAEETKSRLFENLDPIIIYWQAGEVAPVSLPFTLERRRNSYEGEFLDENYQLTDWAGYDDPGDYQFKYLTILNKDLSPGIHQTYLRIHEPGISSSVNPRLFEEIKVQYIVPVDLEANHAQELVYQINFAGLDFVPDSYSIHSGPADLVVNNTGELRWTPRAPMFTKEELYKIQVKVKNEAGSLLLPFRITVRDPARSAPLVRTDYFLSNELSVPGNFDEDQIKEILISDGDNILYTLAWNGSEFVQDWVLPYDLTNGGRINSLNAKDINSDGIDEIFIGVRKAFIDYVPKVIPKKFIVLDGETKTVLYQSDNEEPNKNSVWHIRVEDIDNDGVQEVVYLLCNDNTSCDLIVRSSETWEIEWTSGGIISTNQIDIGNLDSDAALEIVIPEGIVYDGESKQVEWLKEDGFGLEVRIIDYDKSGIAEIVGNSGFNNIVTFYSLPVQSQVFAGSISPSRELKTLDIDGDGYKELISWGNVYAYDQATTSMVQVADYALASLYSPYIYGDVRNTGAQEILVSMGTGMAIYSSGRSPQLVWSQNIVRKFNYSYAGGQMARLASGQKRIVYSSVKNSYEKNQYIMSLDPLSGSVGYSTALPNGTVAGLKRNLNVADYDLDGIDEVIFIEDLDTQNDICCTYSAFNIENDSVEFTGSILDIVPDASVTADVNGDNHPDLVTVYAKSGSGGAESVIRIHDVWNDRLIWSSTDQLIGGVHRIIANDVDSDGDIDIIFTSKASITTRTQSIIALLINDQGDFNISSIIASDRYGLTNYCASIDMAVGDINGDGISEIIYACEKSIETTTVRTYNLLLELTHEYVLPFTSTSIYIEETASNKRNFYLGIYANYTVMYDNEIFNLVNIDSVTGEEIWRSPNLLGPVTSNRLFFYDIDDDGYREMTFSVGFFGGSTTKKAMYITR